MKPRMINLLLSIIFSIVFTSCNRDIVVSPVSSSINDIYEIDWVIADDEIEKFYDISRSDVVKDIVSRTGVKPNFRLINQNNEVELKKMVFTNQIPDLLTMKTEDVNSLNFINANLFLPLETYFTTFSPKDAGLIPFDAWKLLRNSNDDMLYGIPGGMISDSSLAGRSDIRKPRDGMFIREDVYNKLGRPDLSNQKKFLSILEDFKLNYHKYIVSNGGEIYPVVFGRNNEGLKTLERIFGIYPLEVAKTSVKHRIYSNNWTNYLNFLSEIGNKTRFDGRVLDLTDQQFDNIMLNNVLIYIGNIDYIEEFNFKYKSDKTKGVNYIWIDPVQVSKNSFIAESGPFGRYLTYICRGIENPVKLVQFISFMLSAEGWQTTHYGILNKHWVLDNKQAVILEDTYEMAAQDYNAFIKSTGIRQIPFLETKNIAELSFSIKTPLIDVTCYETGMKPVPTTLEGIISEKLDTGIYELCKRALVYPTDLNQGNLDYLIKQLRDINGVDKLNSFYRDKYQDNQYYYSKYR